VPQGVIDDLQAVHVDIEKRKDLSLGDGVLHHPVQAAGIQKAGHRVRFDLCRQHLIFLL
jgi:hypothetical protein